MSSPSTVLGAEGRGSHPPEHLLRGLGLVPSDLVNVADGRSGFAWRVRSGAQSAVLRYALSAGEHASRLAALTTAGEAGLPVPRVLGQVADESGALMVLEWLPGVPMAGFLRTNPAKAAECGRRFGHLQRRLHQVIAPGEVWPVPDPPVPDPPVLDPLVPDPQARERLPASEPGPDPKGRAESLLHLDWHPYNVLVDEDGAVTGVIDWDNARAGEPGLDLTRTWAMLTADPGLPEQPEEVRAALPEFTAAWDAGYGSAYELIEPRHRGWVARRMLAEWRTRPLATPDALRPLLQIVEENSEKDAQE